MHVNLKSYCVSCKGDNLVCFWNDAKIKQSTLNKESFSKISILINADIIKIKIRDSVEDIIEVKELLEM